MVDNQSQESTIHEIKRKVQEVLGDVPNLLKLTFEELLQHSDPDLKGNDGSAGRAGKQSGVVSELTVVVPLVQGGAERLRRIFSLVKGNFYGAQKVGTLHDMRFVFLENDTRLLFATTYDGDWDTYINDFATKIPAEMDLLFSAIDGWPGIKSPKVKDFIADHQITSAAWYVANPQVTVAEVRRLVKIDKEVHSFLEKISES